MRCACVCVYVRTRWGKTGETGREARARQVPAGAQLALASVALTVKAPLTCVVIVDHAV